MVAREFPSNESRNQTEVAILTSDRKVIRPKLIDEINITLFLSKEHSIKMIFQGLERLLKG